MTINLERETDISFDFNEEGVLDLVVNTVLDLEECPFESEVNIIFMDNENIRLINYEYRQIDKETDVLSFPMIDYQKPSDFSFLEDEPIDYFNPESGELLLGDIILSLERVKEQAEEYGHSEMREFSFLIVHSMLHLCGYDHIEEEDRTIMEERQKIVMEKLNINR